MEKKRFFFGKFQNNWLLIEIWPFSKSYTVGPTVISFIAEAFSSAHPLLPKPKLFLYIKRVHFRFFERLIVCLRKLLCGSATKVFRFCTLAPGRIAAAPRQE